MSLLDQPIINADNLTTKYYGSPIGRMVDRNLHRVWVDELRSGNRTQATGVLKVPNGGFCCLGVYCEIRGVPQTVEVRDVRFTPVEEPKPREITVFGAVPGYVGSYAVIPAGYGIHVSPGAPTQSWFKEPEFLFGNETIFTCVTQGKEEESRHDRDTYFLMSPVSKFSLPDLNDGGFSFEQIADVIDYFL